MGDVEAVIRAARAGGVGVPDLFHALAAAQLLLATTDEPGPDGAVEPFVFEWNGADHAAVFTSAEHTAQLPAAPAFTAVAGRRLGEGWPDGLHAVINPGIDDLMLVFDDVTVQLLAAPEDAVVLPPS
jgi:type III secretion system (T3SS) SseB-like protein